MTTSDLAWREYNIHEDEDDEQLIDLFQQDGQDDLQEEEFPVGDKTLNLTAQEDYVNSTGMSIWRGSELLGEYLNGNPTLVQNKKRKYLNLN